MGHTFSHRNVLKNAPSHTRLSIENFPYPDSLGVSHKSDLDYSYHEQLVPANSSRLISHTHKETTSASSVTTRSTRTTLKITNVSTTHDIQLDT